MRLVKKADWINYNTGDNRVMELVNNAINYQQKIQIEYNGAWKVISPFALGTSKDGNTVVKAYVYSDSMESDDNGLAPKSYRVDKITNARPCPNEETDKGKYNENLDVMNEYDDLQNMYDKNYGSDKYVAEVTTRLKKIAEDDEMSFEEVKEETIKAIQKMKTMVSEWSVRDTLKGFTQWDFYRGEAMATINGDIARNVCDQLLNYVTSIQKYNADLLYEVAEKVSHYAY